MLRRLRVIDLTSSLTRYSAGLCLQDSIVEERKQGLAPDTLLLLQHYPVYTLGKRGTAADFRTPREELESTGAEVCVVPRGGEVTFHGPGQLVAYPIVGVRQAGLGARAYVEGLEDTLIDCLKTYGISARGRVPGATGVWVGERKIAAIGVRISHGVSSHGIALNVTTDLSYFNHIVPCGIPDKEVTSIALELTQRQQQQKRQHHQQRVADGSSPGAGQEQQRQGQGQEPGASVAASDARPQHQPQLLSQQPISVPELPEFRVVVGDFVAAFQKRLGFAAERG